MMSMQELVEAFFFTVVVLVLVLALALIYFVGLSIFSGAV